MYEGQDFGFVGPSYQAPMVLQDAQDTINFYLEIDPNTAETGAPAKMPLALLGAPGLSVALTFPGVIGGPVRGLWVLPGGQQALAAQGFGVYLVTFAAGTGGAPPTYSASLVGQLLTGTGPVVFRDNGVLENGLGGYCFMVDGKYCYYYLLQGTPLVVTFQASTTNGSPTLTLPGSLPNGLIVSPSTQIAGVGIPASPFPSIIAVDSVGLTVTMSANAVATSAGPESIQLTIAAFGQITDPGYLGASRIAFIEGWIIMNQVGTRTFFTTGPTPYQEIFPGLFFALKDSSTDNLITLYENNRELWLIGERTSEVWFNAGGTGFPFQRLPGVGPQIGCSAQHSITRCGDQLVWLAQNEQGQNTVVATQQYSWVRISTHAVEHAIAQYSTISDAIGYCYEQEGHTFYMLLFPSADATWCYDFTSETWAKRLSWDPVGSVYHRHYSNCQMTFGGLTIVGDYQTNLLYIMSRQVYTDNGAPLRALRRTPHLWKKSTRERMFYSQLQIEFTPGVGLQTGQGSAPQCMLRWSNDGAFTWGNEHWITIGSAGATRNRAIFRQLGEARDRVFEMVIDDPVPRDIIGATLYAEVSPG